MTTVKHYLIVCLMALLALAGSMATLKAEHRHTPRTGVELTSDSDTLYVDDVVDSVLSSIGQEMTEGEGNYAMHWERDDDGEYGLSDNAMALSIVSIVFLSPVLIIAIIFFYRYKRRKQRDMVVLSAIEHGVEIPEGYRGDAIYSDVKTMVGAKPHQPALLHRGIKHASIGLGLVVMSFFFGGSLIRAVGIFVMIYGGGQILISYLTDSKQPDTPQHDEKSE